MDDVVVSSDVGKESQKIDSKSRFVDQINALADTTDVKKLLLNQ